MTTATQDPARAAQSMAALVRANTVYRGRAQIRRDINAGHTTVAEVLLDLPDCCRTMSLEKLLTAQNRWGITRTYALLAKVQMGPTKRLETLTLRQTALLVRELCSE